jgi:cytochrome c peroxidase
MVAAAAGDLAGADGVWELIARRLRANESYVQLFRDAYPEITDSSEISYVHAANAIAAFEAVAYRADNSPFDQYLRGDRQALSQNERMGMVLFYGKAQCATCHSGTFQTDQSFHAIAMPQVGPGKGMGVDGREDHGRSMVTGDAADYLKFRTPTLRNIALTAPYGHDGAYNTLEEVVRHQLNPAKALEEYNPAQLVMPSRADLDAEDLKVQNDPVRRAEIAAACETPAIELSETEISHLVDFLHALTDPDSIDLRLTVPAALPSGLPLFD